MTCSLIKLALTAAVLVVGSAANAAELVQPDVPRQPSYTGEDRHERARRSYEAAQRSYDERRYQEALEASRKLYYLLPTAQTALLRAVIFGALTRYPEGFEMCVAAANLEPTENDLQRLRDEVKRLGERVGMGVISVRAPGTVTVDGQRVRLETFGLSAGDHVLRVEDEGFAPLERKFAVRAGVIHEPIVVQLSKGGGDPAQPIEGRAAAAEDSGQVWPWVLIATGAALVVGGGVAYGAALDNHDELKEVVRTQGPADGPARYDELQSSMQTNQTIAWVLWGLAAATVAGGTTWLLLTPDADEERVEAEPRTTWSVAPLQGGVSGQLSVRF